MSKAKKIISMLLVIAMVLTVAPLSLTASAADATFTAPKVSKVQFSVDTTATTEVIRVAASKGSFSLGTEIVPATPAGIPENSGTYKGVAYAGATPSAPQVVFKITGATLSETPSITSSLTFCSFENVTSSTSGNTTTYTWKIQSGTASAGTDVVFTINYKVAGATYEAFAYSHVENILVMNGFLTYRKNSESSNTCRHSVVAQLQSINMYSGMCQDSKVDNKVVGYINYASTSPADSSNLKGMGSAETLSSESTAYASNTPNDSITGTEQGVLIKVMKETTGTQRNMCTANDTNKSESVVYIDKRKHKSLSDLGMKLIFQNGEAANIGTIYVETVALYSGHKTFGAEDGSFTSDSSATSIMSVSGTGSGNAITSANVYGHIYLPFSGTGPTTVSDSEQQYSMIINVYSNASDRTNRTAAGMNLDFYVHDTSDLWGMYTGAQRGTGSYTCVTSALSGSVLTFDKGVNPQASMYSTGWSAYESAMTTAGKVLVKPDATQAEINAAALALYNAYNGLGGGGGTKNVTINHVNKNTGEVIAVQNYENYPELGNIEAGTTIIGYNANISGYSIVDNTPQTLTIMGKAGEPDTITFYYTPITYNLNIYTNTDENGDGNIDVITMKPGYDSLIKLSDLEHGSKEFYKFDGFYTDINLTNKASDFRMPNTTVTLYVKWVPDDIDINVVMLADGEEIGTKTYSVTPVEGSTVEFARPSAADQPSAEGYLFADFYEDASFTTQAKFPRTYSVGDADDTIYAKMVDVDGKIIFESNGGTAVEDITFTSPATINAPVEPTKTGYVFKGWRYEDGSAVNWPVTLNTQTGFIAYAEWEAGQYTISFNIGGTTTKYDTKEIAPITGAAETLIDPDFYPNEPLKFGYVFNGWSLNGVRYEFDGTNKYPTQNIELKALWKATDASAFADITSYEKLSGNYVETDSASEGDVVTFRMTTQTNFAVGSSVFVFMYDSNFFELVNEGTSAFAVNRENEYIDGINAKIQGVTDDSVLPWPDMARTETKADGSSAYYKAMMITIDPTITMDDYYCAPLNDGKWLVEFKLKVKEGATGSGKVYMSNDWTRTEDNIMGTQFYGWAKDQSESVADTYNNKVTPNLDNAYAIINLDETVPVNTTVTVKANGGAFADGSSEKVFIGRAETEIVDYVRPELEGYHLPDTNAFKLVDGDVFWAEGYYEKEAQNNSVYEAQWIPNDYTIKYYVEGALYATETAAYNQPIPNQVTLPSRQGYEIKGWALTEGGEAIDLATFTCPLGGADLYAVWGPRDDTPYKITVKYVILASGNTVDKTTDMSGTTDSVVKIVETVPSPAEDGVTYITIAELPAVTNYIYDESKNTLPIEATIAADGSTEIVVWYRGKDVIVTYDANGGAWENGDATRNETVLFQDYPAGPTETPVRDGYDFLGWATSKANANNGNVANISATRLTADRTYYAAWSVKKYPATFNVNGGAWADGTTEDKVSEFEFGKAVTAPETPAKEGFVFKGWATSADATEAESLGTMDNTDGKTYYAVYALAEYTVTYKLDGVQLYVDTYHMGDAVTLRGAETKTGYSFSGWMLGGAATTDFTMPAEDVVLEATFTANTYEVVFDANGGYFDGDLQAKTKSVATKFDAAIAAPAQPSRNGYEFIGWAAAPDSTDKVTNFGNLTTTETVTYYAIWNATTAEYTINIYYMDATGAYPAAADKTEVLSGLVGTASPEYDPAGNLKTGFTFDAANSVLSGIIDADNPLVLTVKYARNQWTLTKDIDGVKTEIGKFYYQADITVPEAPEKTGYNFTGWNNIPADSKMPNYDVELVATWEAKNYTVTWIVDGETQTTTEPFGGEIHPVADPTKTGHTFAGWDGYTAGMTMPAEDVTFTATWTKNSYTITYRTYNGVYKTESVPYGDVIVLPEAPEREGYTFTGWQGYTDGMTMPATNPTFVAQWQINSYDVTWDVDGETTVEAYEYGAAISEKAAPSKEGYTFTGWEGYTNGMTMPAEKLTFTAKWEVNNYTVTWDVDGAKTEETYAYGAAISEKAAPSKEGYTFAGWEGYTEGMTMPAANQTFKATWTVNNYTVTWDVDGVKTEETYAYGSTINEKAAPTKEGYTFTGWTPEVPATMPAENLTFAAAWTVNNYTVTWIVDGETIKTETIAYGEAVTAPVPEKAGYTFSGWTPAVPATQGAKDATYEGTFLANSDILYTIETYVMDLEGAYGTPERETKEGVTDSLIVLDPEEKTGFTLDREFSILEGTVAANGSLVLEVYYARNEYDVITNVDGKENVVDTVYFEAVIAEPAAPSKEGYTFAGWEGYTAGMKMPADNVTLKAQWTVNQYTITFDSNGGSAVESITADYGTAVTAPAAPTKTGYTFAGWDTEIPATMPAGNMTITAKWTVNQYTIAFNTDGGSAVESITADYGATVTAPAAPTKTGYTFAGWDTEIPTTMPAGDMTITAKWTINQYTITFNTDGGSTVESITADYGAAVTAPKNPTKEGYTFRNWDKTIPTTMPAGDMTITAQWTVNSYRIEWKVDNVVVSANAYDFGEEIVAPADPEKTGYNFAGWTWTKEDGSAAASSTTMPAYNVVVTAQWTAADDTAYTVEIYKMSTAGAYEKVETVTGLTGTTEATAVYAVSEEEGFTVNAEKTTGYDAAANTANAVIKADGSTVISVYYARNKYTFKSVVDGEETTATYYYDEAVTVPAAPTKEGYTFAGWDPTVPATMPAEDVTVIAQWTVNNYTIAWTIDGETTTETYAYGSDVTALEIPAKNGHRVVGWMDASNKIAVIPATMPASNLAYTAVYETNVYDVNYYVDGKLVSTVSSEFGEAIQSIKFTAPFGYEFDGWYTDAEMTSKLAADATVGAEETKLYGKIVAEKYKATFIVDGEEYAVVETAFDAQIAAPADPEKVGYTFIGWTPDVSIMDEEGKTFYANFEATKDAFAITYIVDGKSEDFNLAAGDEFEIPADPFKEGYTFAGWADAEGNIVEEFPATMPAQNLTYTATWTVNKYTVTWDVDGATTTETYEFGAAIVKKEAPAKEGYTFAAWDGYTDGMTMPAENITITATWNVNEYTVTWIIEGAETVETYAYGAAVVAPEATKEGWTFTGWFVDGNRVEVPATMPAENLEFTANFSQNTFTVTWIVDGVETVETYGYGDTILEKAAPVKEGYTFAGWEGYTADMTMPAENLTFTAAWTVNEYTVTWIVDGVETEETYAYGATIVEKEAPVKEGWSFVAWDPEVPATMPAEDLEFTAIFVQDTVTVTFYDYPETAEPYFDTEIADRTEVYATQTYDAGATIVLPEAPTFEYYTFAGWIDAEGNAYAEGDVADSNKAYYASYERVAVTLVAVDGSTTVIERHATDPEQNYIYGFTNKRALPTTANLTTKYITNTGDGTIEIVRREGMESQRYLGTGTKVILKDNVTGEVVESFYLIYFGDVNGDCLVNQLDYNNVDSELSVGRTWSALRGNKRVPYMIKAANLDGAANIQATDRDLLNASLSSAVTINQATGLAN